MRIFSLLIKFLILFGVIGGLIYGIAPLILLNVAKAGMTKELEKLTTYNSDRQSYIKQCAKAPAASEGSQPIALQLRFINNQEYVIELICTLVENTPVPITSQVLPPIVMKVAGSSGFYLDFDRPQSHSVRLKSFWKTQDITFDGKTVTTTPQTTITKSALPKTACAGMGYQCCSMSTQRGEGDSYSGATDCAMECFSACTAIPYILTFSSDPYPQNDQRVTMSGETQDVTFSYVSDVAGGQIANVTISFGDGEEATSTESSGIFAHTYTCPGACSYEVVVRATDTKGNVSVENDLSKLYIERQ